MAQFVSNTVGNTENVNTLITSVFEKLNNGSLFADKESTIFGSKTSLMINENITKDIESTNLLLTQLYQMMNTTDNPEKIKILQIQSSNNGERSFDVQVIASIFINGENKIASFYINLTQGSNRVNRKEKKYNAKTLEAQKAVQEVELIQSSISELTDATEKLQIATETAEKKMAKVKEAEINLEKAKVDFIENFWIRKFQMILINF